MNIDSLDTGAALAWEAELFAEVSKRPEKRFVKLWEGSQSLVAPKKLAALPGFVDAAATMAAEGWPVHLRSTGGDVTPQGPGIMNVTHVYTWDSGGVFDIAAAYDRLCTPIERALGPGASRGWQPGAFCDGAYNVQWRGRKFAGTALRYRPCRDDKQSHTVLAHALMLFAPQPPEVIAAITRFLAALGEDRLIAADAHTSLPENLDPDLFLQRLAQAFQNVALLL